MKLLGRSKRTDEASDLPDFAGKILAIYCNSEQRGGMFQDVRFTQVGFGAFLVGRRVGLEPALQQRWSGVTVWTAITDIAQMLVFDDIEAAKRAFQTDAT